MQTSSPFTPFYQLVGLSAKWDNTTVSTTQENCHSEKAPAAHFHLRTGFAGIP
jgi:hypothetical protein